MMKQVLIFVGKFYIVIVIFGRLVDYFKSIDIVDFKRIKFLVFDEVDRFLDLLFGDDLQVIFDNVLKKR